MLPTKWEGYPVEQSSPLPCVWSGRLQRPFLSPIMGMGGVSSARDVIEMMLAGATAVQVGAANLTNPYAAGYHRRTPGVMKSLGIESLQEIVGGAHS